MLHLGVRQETAEGSTLAWGGSGFPSMEIDPKRVLMSENNKAPMFPFAIPASSCGSACSTVVPWRCQGIISAGAITALCSSAKGALPSRQFLQGVQGQQCWWHVGHTGWPLQPGHCSRPLTGRQEGRSSIGLKDFGLTWSCRGVGAGNSQRGVSHFPEVGLQDHVKAAEAACRCLGRMDKEGEAWVRRRLPSAQGRAELMQAAGVKCLLLLA